MIYGARQPFDRRPSERTTSPASRRCTDDRTDVSAEQQRRNNQTSNPERVVPTRRISFDEGLAELPKHFAADGDLIMSHLMASLSAVFPDGEDFFVRSVRYYRDRITDPDLKRQVSGFIGQESVHGREHRALNDRLDELGYPVKEGEAITRWGLQLREKFLPPVSNLAATAALEHFTATLAELVLSDPEMRATAAPGPVHDLFLWHALEESEHKAVAFDVYKAVGGSEWLRTLHDEPADRRLHRRHDAVRRPVDVVRSLHLQPPARSGPAPSASVGPRS